MQNIDRINSIIESFSSLDDAEKNSLLISLMERTQASRLLTVTEAEKVKSDTEKAMLDLEKAIRKMKFSQYPVSESEHLSSGNATTRLNGHA